MESIAPDKRDISVEFVVDSVAEKTSNGDLVADVNVIQLLAYLDQDSDEYQSYMGKPATLSRTKCGTASA